MNQKFRDLQIQAFAECKTFEDGQFRTDEVFERFAELIVRECVDICHKLAKESDSYVVHDGDTCATQIKKHFGVEE